MEHTLIKPGRNVYAITGQRFRKKQQWDEPNTDPGLVQVIEPAKPWKRKVFNGLAQIILQSTVQPGEIRLTAASTGLTQAVMKVQAQASALKPTDRTK